VSNSIVDDGKAMPSRIILSAVHEHMPTAERSLQSTYHVHAPNAGGNDEMSEQHMATGTPAAAITHAHCNFLRMPEEKSEKGYV